MLDPSAFRVFHVVTQIIFYNKVVILAKEASFLEDIFLCGKSEYAVVDSTLQRTMDQFYIISAWKQCDGVVG